MSRGKEQCGMVLGRLQSQAVSFICEMGMVIVCPQRNESFCSVSVLVSTSETDPAHTGILLLGRRKRRSLALVGMETPGSEVGDPGGSAVTGQGRYAGQGRQQLCIYVNPTEEHGLVQPLIMVVQQHRCAVHG